MVMPDSMPATSAECSAPEQQPIKKELQKPSSTSRALLKPRKFCALKAEGLKLAHPVSRSQLSNSIEQRINFPTMETNRSTLLCLHRSINFSSINYRPPLHNRNQVLSQKNTAGIPTPMCCVDGTYPYRKNFETVKSPLRNVGAWSLSSNYLAMSSNVIGAMFLYRHLLPGYHADVRTKPSTRIELPPQPKMFRIALAFGFYIKELSPPYYWSRRTRLKIPDEGNQVL